MCQPISKLSDVFAGILDFWEALYWVSDSDDDVINHLLEKSQQ